MPALTSQGETLVRDLAARHGFGDEAVTGLLAAMVTGQGHAAQFSHSELGGNGQWMSGGMLMIGDMFNNALKARVGALCDDLARAVTSAGTGSSAVRTQRQTQGDGTAVDLAGTPFFDVPASGASDAWWPDELGTPSASGAQNSMRYAWFADARRLVVDDGGGGVRVHDTPDHRIGGFSQQQGGGDGLTLSSQHGTVDLAALPVVSLERAGKPVRPDVTDVTDVMVEPTATADVSAATDALPIDTHVADGEVGEVGEVVGKDDAAASVPPRPASSSPPGDDPLQLIERLGRLRDQGLVSDEEFADKKRELLARL